jgi:hypothetical protein
VSLGEGGLKQHRVEGLWSKDRKHLIECGSKLAAVTDYYRKRDAALQD